MKKIVINSDNRRFNISSIVVGYLEENKEEVLEFEIPEKYAEYGKKACFSANGIIFAKNFDNVISNKLTITRDVSQFKELDMSIEFFKIENEDEIVARTSILHIYIENAIVCDDDVKPDEPKIIVLDNLIQKVQELDNEISLNENERLRNENIRQTNEEERINNESSREEYITNLKDKVDEGEFNGKSLEFVWQGTKLGIRLQGQQEYQFVDLVGAVGPIGPQGNPFQVKKTYATIDDMINDYDNMQINDYVMISGNIEEEDNAKLFVKTENETPVYRWQYLADFSGASGIQGPAGKDGADGKDGIGIKSIVKTSTSGLIDTYTITFTDSTTNTFTVTNGKDGADGKDGIDGKDGNVLQQEAIDELNAEIDELVSILPKKTSEGTNSLEYDNAKEFRIPMAMYKGNVEQDGEPNPDYPMEVKTLKGWNMLNIYDNQFQSVNGMSKVGDKCFLNGITFELKEKGIIEVNGTATANSDCYLAGSWSSTSPTFMKLKKGTYVLSNKGNVGYVYINNKTSIILSTDVVKSFNTDDVDLTSMFVRIPVGTTVKNGTIIPQLTIKKDRPFLPYGAIAIRRKPKNIIGDVIHGNLNEETGNFVSDKQRWVTRDFIKVESNELYTLSCVPNVYNQMYYIFHFYDENYNFISASSLISSTGYKETTTPINCKYMKCVIADTQTITTINHQLEKGPKTDYEPSTENISYIDLQDNEVLSTDELILRDGHIWLKKNMPYIVLDGTETYFKSATELNVYATSFNLKIAKNKCICSHFMYKKVTEIDNSCINYIVYNLNNNNTYIVFSSDAMQNSIDKLKEWLKEQYDNGTPVIIYYLLDEPIEIDLGKTTLKSLEGMNNVEILATLEPTFMSETYVYDLEKEVNEKALQQELIDINSRLSALETAQTSATSESEAV